MPQVVDLWWSGAGSNRSPPVANSRFGLGGRNTGGERYANTSCGWRLVFKFDLLGDL